MPLPISKKSSRNQEFQTPPRTALSQPGNGRSSSCDSLARLAAKMWAKVRGNHEYLTDDKIGVEEPKIGGCDSGMPDFRAASLKPGICRRVIARILASATLKLYINPRRL